MLAATTKLQPDLESAIDLAIFVPEPLNRYTKLSDALASAEYRLLASACWTLTTS